MNGVVISKSACASCDGTGKTSHGGQTLFEIYVLPGSQRAEIKMYGVSVDMVLHVLRNLMPVLEDVKRKQAGKLIVVEEHKPKIAPGILEALWRESQRKK
jgi:hypothetical protein